MSALPRSYLCQEKLHRNVVCNSLHLVTKSSPLKYILSRPALSGRVARWLLRLNKFDITAITLRGLQSQALSDLLAQFLSGSTSFCMKTLPYKEICSAETGERSLAFYGSSTHQGGGAGVVLYDPDTTSIPYLSSSSCSINEVEYKALIIRLISALQMGFVDYGCKKIPCSLFNRLMYNSL